MQIDKSMPCSKDIYTKSKSTRKIEYIVIHFVGDGGVPAKNYAKCNRENNAHREASWHYVVGDSTENYKIYQSVEDNDVAWHCGAKSYIHPKCRNNNSIGIEHCCYWKNGKAYFEDGTIKASVELVVELMKKYNIPIENVITHNAVTGKACPQPFLYNDGKWEDYIKQIKDKLTSNVEDKELADAVSKIIRSGISIDFNSWKRLDIIELKNVDALITRLGGLDKLVKDGIVSDVDIWKSKKYNKNHVKSLIIKFASKK